MSSRQSSVELVFAAASLGVGDLDAFASEVAVWLQNLTVQS